MKLFLILTSLALTATASASQLTLTCSESAYEALEKNDLSKAEFSLVLHLKGANIPAELVSITDNYADIKDNVKSVDYQPGQVTVKMNNSDKYEITSITGCEDLDTGTADIAYSRYLGPHGINPYDSPVRAKCNCLKK